jgi:hypothetical protein
MITTLALALILAQDPKPPAKTVEDRLKELADKIEALDKKAAALTDENAKLQLKVDEAKTRRETFARQSGTVWVKRYAGAVEFTEKQSTEIEELWYGWSKSDFEKPSDLAQWKSREETLRGKLTADQVPKLTRKVRDEQELNVKNSINALAQFAKLPPERSADLEKAVQPRINYGEATLLAQAHPESINLWPQVLAAVETALPELAATLSESEATALRKVLDRWKPKQR